LIAADLEAVGISVDCIPVADVPVAGANWIIGERAYGDGAAEVSAIAAEIAAGLQEGGVLPVVKHLPGHGRATADSHERLPVVAAPRELLEATDFAAFMPLAQLPLGMTAHVDFTALDPGVAATTSRTIIGEVIRRIIGFTGALMSDDISMGALSGSIAERTQRALAAGCDFVLHCNGNLAEMEDVAETCPELSGAAFERAERALASRRAAEPIDLHEARARFAALLAGEHAVTA
jgi:beta-N-acetylhexosaminidase